MVILVALLVIQLILSEIFQQRLGGCHEMLYRHAWSPEDESYSLWWSPDFISATLRLTFVVQGEISQQLLD